LVTVGAPPMMETAPPFTKSCPAALELTVIVLFRLSPKTLNVPNEDENKAEIDIIVLLI
jgi:hypothetical protein